MSTSLTKVRICNMALAYVGATPIEDLIEKTKEASQCRLWYDPCRLEILRMYNWSFARKRTVPACHGDAPPNAWAYRYQYPSDAVAIRYISNPFETTGPGGPFMFGTDWTINWENSTDAIPFTVEMSDNGTKSILTNEQCPELIYTFDQETTAYFSLGFVKALAYRMAHEMAFDITGKRALAGDLLQIAHQMVRQAAADDATEEVTKPPREAEWIRGR